MFVLLADIAVLDYYMARARAAQPLRCCVLSLGIKKIVQQISSTVFCSLRWIHAYCKR